MIFPKKKKTQIILHFQKKNCNYVHYWNEKKSKLESLFGQNHNKIWIFKVYVFVMFKVKHLINKMQWNTLSQQVGWLDG